MIMYLLPFAHNRRAGLSLLQTPHQLVRCGLVFQRVNRHDSKSVMSVPVNTVRSVGGRLVVLGIDGCQFTKRLTIVEARRWACTGLLCCSMLLLRRLIDSAYRLLSHKHTANQGYRPDDMTCLFVLLTALQAYRSKHGLSA